MRRLELYRYGPVRDAVRFADVPTPTPMGRDVLIRVQAAGINPLDYKIVAGALRRLEPLALPAPLGFDCCGVVEAAGPDVTTFAPGAEVYPRLPRGRTGSFAEYALVDAQYVAHKPAGLSSTDAASLPLVALTTVQALVDRARARPGQAVLIHAGSGGLGSFAVQYAKHVLGLHVTTTCSSRNRAWVAALGADMVVPYDREDYSQLGHRFDVVFDTIDGEATAASFAMLKPGGTVVSVAGPPDRHFAGQVGASPPKSFVLRLMGLLMEWRARRVGGRYFRFLTESSGPQLEHIAHVVAAGQVRPVVDTVYPFIRAIEALEHAATGHTRGKLVLEMA